MFKVIAKAYCKSEEMTKDNIRKSIMNGTLGSIYQAKILTKEITGSSDYIIASVIAEYEFDAMIKIIELFEGLPSFDRVDYIETLEVEYHDL